MLKSTGNDMCSKEGTLFYKKIVLDSKEFLIELEVVKDTIVKKENSYGGEHIEKINMEIANKIKLILRKNRYKNITPWDEVNNYLGEMSKDNITLYNNNVNSMVKSMDNYWDKLTNIHDKYNLKTQNDSLSDEMLDIKNVIDYGTENLNVFDKVFEDLYIVDKIKVKNITPFIDKLVAGNCIFNIGEILNTEIYVFKKKENLNFSEKFFKLN